MILSRCRALCLSALILAGGAASVAQEPLTLRQAIEEALGHNPEAATARADSPRCQSRIRGWRGPNFCRNSTLLKIFRAATTGLCLRNPAPAKAIHASRLRAECVEFPSAHRQFLHALFRLLDGLRLLQNAEGDSPRRSLPGKAPPPPPRRWTSRLSSAWSRRISRFSTRSGRSTWPSMSRRRRRRCWPPWMTM